MTKLVTSKKGLELFGEPNINANHYMIMMNVDIELQLAYSCLPKRIYINAITSLPLKKVLFKIKQEGLEREIKSISCFNIRPIRGYEKTNPIIWSTHSWGISIDVNEIENKLCTTGNMNPKIIAIFESEGFYWGGRFKRKDPMHFELTLDYILNTKQNGL
jgi:hypothetical protein